MNYASDSFFENRLLLVAGKDPDSINLMKELKNEDYIVCHVATISEAIRTLNHDEPDLIVMDSSYNEVACFELCHAIKSIRGNEKKRVIILSDRNEESIEIEAFRSGADEFILKPVRIKAFLSRLKSKANLKQDAVTVQQKMNGQSRIKIDRESYTVFVNNNSLNFSRKEFELLYLMASHPDKIFTRDELSEKVWKRKMKLHERTIDVHILRVRKKLGEDFIYTQKGVGYKFKV